jgi:hypothetical protein
MIDIQKMYFYTLVDGLKKLGLSVMMPDDDGKIQEYGIEAVLLQEQTLAGKIELLKAVFQLWKVLKEAQFTQTASLAELARVDFQKVNEYFDRVVQDIQGLFLDKSTIGDVGVNIKNINDIVGKIQQIKSRYDSIYSVKEPVVLIEEKKKRK